MTSLRGKVTELDNVRGGLRFLIEQTSKSSAIEEELKKCSDCSDVKVRALIQTLSNQRTIINSTIIRRLQNREGELERELEILPIEKIELKVSYIHDEKETEK